MLNKSISLAQEQIQISSDEAKVIKHCRKSLLFDNEDAWLKNISSTLQLEVLMVLPCKLISLHLLHELSKLIDRII